jgi:hypothetical protein
MLDGLRTEDRQPVSLRSPELELKLKPLSLSRDTFIYTEGIFAELDARRTRRFVSWASHFAEKESSSGFSRRRSREALKCWTD